MSIFKTTSSLKIMLSIIALMYVMFFLVFLKTTHDLNTAKTTFLEKHDDTTSDTAKKLNDKADILYRLLRTIGRLPGIKDLNNKHQISSEAKTAAQEIYNNLYSVLKVSEVYITTKDFNSEKLNPKTGRPLGLPVLFDQFVVGQHIPTKLASHDIEEIEEYEYAEIQKQIQYFKERYPTVAKITGLDYPGITSSEMIICDNSRYSLDHPNDKDRTGIIFSVPYYDETGNFSGLISGIGLSSVISEMIDDPNIAIIGKNGELVITSKLSNKRVESVDFSKSASLLASDYYISEKPLISPLFRTKWIIRNVIPKSDFYSFPEARSAILFSLFSSLIILIVGISLLYFTHLTFKQSQWIKKRNEELEIELRKRTAELSAQSLKLIQASRLSDLGQMSASIAHEINNPLAVIKGRFSVIENVLTSENIDKNKISENLLKAQKTVEKIVSIVRSLKAFSRHETQDPMAPFSLNEIMLDTFELCAEKVRSNNIDFRLNPIPNVRLLCYPVEVMQVVLNLISNSIDAVRGTRNSWIELSYKVLQEEKKLALIVTDSGNGIPEEVIEKLMDPFFTTKEQGKGTGLGLSISKRIAEAHGGSLELDRSCPNTRFILKIQLAD